ncbi:MAG TPA: FAD-dependent oxidoreductase, partial [Roseateles sp.]|nr:FAD-dependent oxidoreductase [Roseateles sp.]
MPDRPPLSDRVDVAILGGGPAGCSAASWLAQLGLSVALIERAPQLCKGLQALTFRQDWVLGAPGLSLAELGARYAAQTEALAGLQLLKGRSAAHLDWLAGEGWRLRLDDGRDLAARALLLATGLRPLRPTPFFPDEAGHERVLDALGLTARREQLPPGQRILLLGGGDNAAENALFLQARGHRVSLWSRSDWRAQQGLVERLEALGDAIEQRPRDPLPTQLRPDADGVTVASPRHGEERYDRVAVLLGYEAEPSAWLLVADALQRAGITAPSHPFRD